MVVYECSVTQSLGQSNEIHFLARAFNISIIECMNITMKICQISNSLKPENYLVCFLLLKINSNRLSGFFHLYTLRIEYYFTSSLAALYLHQNESMITFISTTELCMSSYLSKILKYLGKMEKSLVSSGVLFNPDMCPFVFH